MSNQELKSELSRGIRRLARATGAARKPMLALPLATALTGLSLMDPEQEKKPVAGRDLATDGAAAAKHAHVKAAVFAGGKGRTATSAAVLGSEAKRLLVETEEAVSLKL